MEEKLELQEILPVNEEETPEAEAQVLPTEQPEAQTPETPEKAPVPEVPAEAAANREEDGPELAEIDQEQLKQLRQELDQLKREKRRGILLDEVREILVERQVPGEFADFLVSDALKESRSNALAFCRRYELALQQALAARLPRGLPRDFDAVQPAPRRRGIVRK